MLPRLLDNSLHEVRRLNASSLTIIQNATSISTATMNLPHDQAIPIRSWVELFTPKGSAGVYRTHAPSTTYGGGIDSYNLDHAICELGDFIIEEEIEESQFTLLEIMQRLFTHYKGNKWQLGSVCNGSVNVSESYQNLLQYMYQVIDQVNGAYMTFDFSTSPWTVNVELMDANVSAEGRLSRNIRSVTIKQDDTNLATRISMDSLGEDYVDADTINTWGVVEKRLTGEFLKQEAIAYATAYLNKYKNPLYTITIDGYDFYDITGETLDSVEIGKKYRIVIPDDDLILEKPVIAIKWNDLVANPNYITITLGEPAATITGKMMLEHMEQTKRNEKYEGSIKFNSRQLETLFTETGVDDLEEGETLYSKIGQTAEDILLEVADDYYSKKSGVEITADGVEVTGDMYIKLKTDTSNNDAFIQANEWEFNKKGLIHQKTGEQETFQLAHTSDKIGSSHGIFYVSNATLGQLQLVAKSEAHSSTWIVEIDETGDAVSCFRPGVGRARLGTTDHYVNVYGQIVSNSSRDVKHDIHPLPSMGSTIDQLRPVEFVYDNDENEEKQFGLIYEETIDVLPEICTKEENDKCILYARLIPILLKETQELRARVSDLERRL